MAVHYKFESILGLPYLGVYVSHYIFFKHTYYLLLPNKFLNNVQGANEGSLVLRVACIAYCFSMNIDIV